MVMGYIIICPLTYRLEDVIQMTALSTNARVIRIIYVHFLV